MSEVIDPDDLVADDGDSGAFDDWDDDPDDAEELDAYAVELAAAVEAFGVPVIEPGQVY